MAMANQGDVCILLLVWIASAAPAVVDMLVPLSVHLLAACAADSESESCNMGFFPLVEFELKSAQVSATPPARFLGCIEFVTMLRQNYVAEHPIFDQLLLVENG